MSVSPSGDAQLSFYAEPEDLEQVRADVLALGFQPSRVYQRARSHRIDTRYGTVEFERTESSVRCPARSLIWEPWREKRVIIPQRPLCTAKA